MHGMISMKDNLAVVLKGARATDELTMYGIVPGAPGLSFRTATVVQYVAAVAGSLVGFMSQFSA
jgi:hypothetical protein